MRIQTRAWMRQSFTCWIIWIRTWAGSVRLRYYTALTFGTWSHSWNVHTGESRDDILLRWRWLHTMKKGEWQKVLQSMLLYGIGAHVLQREWIVCVRMNWTWSDGVREWGLGHCEKSRIDVEEICTRINFVGRWASFIKVELMIFLLSQRIENVWVEYGAVQRHEMVVRFVKTVNISRVFTRTARTGRMMGNIFVRLSIRKERSEYLGRQRFWPIRRSRTKLYSFQREGISLRIVGKQGVLFYYVLAWTGMGRVANTHSCSRQSALSSITALTWCWDVCTCGGVQ